MIQQYYNLLKGGGSPRVNIEGAIVWLLTGQSNMQGQANVSQMPTGHLIYNEMPNVYIWNHKSSTEKQWEKYHAGYNTQHALYDRYTDLWYGPEAAFGHYLAQAYGKPVYIIKLGYGGSTLGNTGGNRVWNKAANDLYPIFITEYAVAALAALEAQGLTPNIRGHFRYQGENDANGDYANFQANREQLTLDLKQDLGIGDFHEIETRIRNPLPTSGGYNYNSVGAAAVRAAQEAFVNAETVNRRLITVDDCTVRTDDNVHIDGQLTGQWEVGKRAAIAAAQWEGITVS